MKAHSRHEAASADSRQPLPSARRRNSAEGLLDLQLALTGHAGEGASEGNVDGGGMLADALYTYIQANLDHIFPSHISLKNSKGVAKEVELFGPLVSMVERLVAHDATLREQLAARGRKASRCPSLTSHNRFAILRALP